MTWKKNIGILFSIFSAVIAPKQKRKGHLNSRVMILKVLLRKIDARKKKNRP